MTSYKAALVANVLVVISLAAIRVWELSAGHDGDVIVTAAFSAAVSSCVALLAGAHVQGG